MTNIEKVIFPSPGEKWDIQLKASIEQHEPRLRNILEDKKIELKTESWQWELYGNLCIEYAGKDGRLSGISITTADWWMHELLRDDQTLVYFMFPVQRLKQLCRKYWWNRRVRAGDGGRTRVIPIPIAELIPRRSKEELRAVNEARRSK